MNNKAIKWDLQVDFIAVGSGCGSMTSAIVAHDLGKKTVILEKAPSLGGVSAYSGGEVFLPNNYKMQEAGTPDSDEEGRKYLDFLSAGYNDTKMLDRTLEAAPLAVEYLEKKQASSGGMSKIFRITITRMVQGQWPRDVTWKWRFFPGLSWVTGGKKPTRPKVFPRESPMKNSLAGEASAVFTPGILKKWQKIPPQTCGDSVRV